MAPKINTSPKKQNKNKYCRSHKDHGHNIEGYIAFKDEIEALIQRGYLYEFVASRQAQPRERSEVQQQRSSPPRLEQ